MTVNEIRALVLRNGIGRTELVEAAGVAPQTLQRVLDDEPVNTTTETLSKLKTGIDRVIADREAAAQRILNPAPVAAAGER